MLAAKNEIMETAVNELYRVSADSDVRRRYSLRERAWRDEQARTAYALQQGLQQGIQQTKAELVRFFKNGGSLEEFLERNSST
jgi:hypothetical protein